MTSITLRATLFIPLMDVNLIVYDDGSIADEYR